MPVFSKFTVQLWKGLETLFLHSGLSPMALYFQEDQSFKKIRATKNFDPKKKNDSGTPVVSPIFLKLWILIEGHETYT